MALENGGVANRITKRETRNTSYGVSVPLRNSEKKNGSPRKIHIGESAADLWPKGLSTRWPSAILNLKKIIFGHETVVQFQICCFVPNFINIPMELGEIEVSYCV